MGVPAFFRWLSRKYASIVVHCVEEKAREVDGVKFPVDASLPNPNDYEFDNLYLDMNGIIHPCCHPENKPAPKNEDEMMVLIFEYIDRIFAICRPRKLLYMAIDGVAPRAKMNQQRSRRFRASKETSEKTEEIAKIRSDLTAKGARLPPEKEKTEHFDSNCITPGTEFMANLSICLRYYIADRLNNDPGWKNIKVVLSDANTPGEGEHKIMDYIRKQRASPGHDPNTKHCLNGADADLIMLGLATHEPHFTIIREEFKPNQKRPCELCGQVGHMLDECMGLPKEKEGEHDELTKPVAQDVEFIFIRLNVLREYLERELEMQSLPFPYDFERCVDDWVFMCFFVGNDFLPHLPSLEIREGAIDRLVKFYKNVVPRCGGYITDNGYVNLTAVQLVLSELGYVEDEIFKKRQQDNISYKKRLKANKEREKRQKMRDNPQWVPGGQFSPHLLGTGTPGAITSPRQQAYDMRKQGMASTSGQARDNHTAAADLRSMLTKAPDSSQSPNTSVEAVKRKADDDDEDPPDNIRLWEDGWKGRYYTNKFGITESDEGFNDFRKKVADAYVEGLCWVLRYYYQGCPSWKWYYPYHYAPFASDFRDLDQLKNEFEMSTKPFHPLEQLMSVFPAASGTFLPPTWRNLMSNPESPIIDFYPVDFDIDLNGKKYAWQGVALLPFVDEKRMLSALAEVYPDITDEERKRNSLGKERLFLREGNPAFDFFKALYEDGGASEPIAMVTDLTQGMSGLVEPEKDKNAILPNTTIPSPVVNLRDLPDNRSIGVLYEDPFFEEGHIYKTALLPGVEMPPRVLKPGGLGNNKSWRPAIGMNTQRRSYASIAPAGHRMANYHTRDAQQGQSGTPRPSRFSGGGGGGGGYDPRRGGYGASYDPRSSYGGADNSQNYRQTGYGNSNYGNSSQGNRNYGNSNYGGSNYGGNSGYGNNSNQYQQGYGGHNQHQSSRGGHQGNQPRDPRQQHSNSQDDQRRHSYPLSNYRYKPY